MVGNVYNVLLLYAYRDLLLNSVILIDIGKVVHFKGSI